MGTRTTAALFMSFAMLGTACVGSNGAAEADTATESPSQASSQVVDLTPAEPVDPDAAGSMSEATVAPTGSPVRELEPGEWFTDRFSTPLAFRLPVPARLVEDLPGHIVMETGPADAPTGSLQLVEAVAYNSADGAVPLGSFAPGEEFPMARRLESGIVEANGHVLHWQDFVLDASTVPTSMQSDCPYPTNSRCTSLLLGEFGPALTELDYLHRYIGRDFGDRRLFIIGDGNEGHPEIADAAFEIAASIEPAAERTTKGPQSLQAVGLRSNSLPAGEWYTVVGDARLTLNLEEELNGVGLYGVNPPLGVGFRIITGTDEDRFLSVRDFVGFPSGVDSPDPLPDSPLTAEEFVAGFNEILAVNQLTEVTIFGVDAVSWTVDKPPQESPFECTAAQRSGLDDQSICINITANTNVIVGGDETRPGQFYYVESYGVLIFGTVGINEFDPLKAAIRIEPAP